MGCKRIRILAISDIHGRIHMLRRLGAALGEEPDLLLIAGDITNFGTLSEAESILKEALRQIKPREGLVYVAGNCDPSELLDARLTPGDIIGLHCTAVKKCGIVIGGIGGSTVTPFGTIVEFTEEEYATLLERLRERWRAHDYEGCMRILLTHEPPYDTDVDITRDGTHVGSKSLREFLEREEGIVLHVCGHIHEGRGTDLVGNVHIVNPGPLGRGFYAWIEINEAGRVTIRLEEV